MTKMIYNLKEAARGDKNLLGGKGYHVAQLDKLATDLSLSFEVPPACIIPTTLWKAYNQNKKKALALVKDELIPQIISELSENGVFPLVSVRSGAPVSMPGMMDTVLNLGIHSGNVEDFAKQGSKAWAYDCYARYLTMYGEIALDIDKKLFEKVKKEKFKTVKELEKAFGDIYKKAGEKLPGADIENQLLTAISAVLSSWNNERATIYRQINNIDDNLGTAIIVQKMVFGNKNENSGTAVVFSRDTNTGSSTLSGEYLINAQGEDVVSGSRTPEDIIDMREWNADIFQNIKSDVKKLEEHFKEVQDVELTIEDGKLYFLQTRTAKRTPQAAVKIAMDMVSDGLISKEEAFSKLTLKDYLALNNKQVDPSYKVAADAQGLPASSGVMLGRVVFDLRGTELTEEGEPTILLAKETTPDDMPVLKEVSGVLTCVGGVTSHAAVVARSLNKTAVVGASDIKIFKENDSKRDTWYAIINNHKVVENDELTLDAQTGRVWVGRDVPIIDGAQNKNLLKLEDLVFEVYPFARAVSNTDDMFSDKNMVYTTYRLDGENSSEVEKQLFTAIEIMQDSEPEDYFAVIDLQGKLDFIEATFEETVPFTQSLALSNFEEKAEVMLKWSGEKDKFQVYLGKYTELYGDKFKEYGFNVAPENYLQLQLGSKASTVVKDNAKFLTVVDSLAKHHLEKPSRNLVISGKNAILSLLPR